MDEATYKQWCPLHWRSALGEPLSAEEQARYEAGLRQLEAEEHIGFDMRGYNKFVSKSGKRRRNGSSWKHGVRSWKPVSRWKLR